MKLHRICTEFDKFKKTQTLGQMREVVRRVGYPISAV